MDEIFLASQVDKERGRVSPLGPNSERDDISRTSEWDQDLWVPLSPPR